MSRVRRTRSGGYRLRIPANERDLLRSLPGQLRDLLETDDPALERLFPPAYPDDADRDREYQDMARADLIDGRRSALEIMESTIDADEVDVDELDAWMRSLNDLRIVLGTRMGVTEETTDHPEREAFALYLYLGWLLEQVVAALGDG